MKTYAVGGAVRDALLGAPVNDRDWVVVGATPEEIAQDFPVLQLDDVYAAITYYLWHREEVEAYLERRRALAEDLRRQIEARSPQTGLRERLLARLGRG